jgi:COP9 signalosome complex subunit 5
VLFSSHAIFSFVSSDKYFSTVKVSSLALMKLVMHACIGNKNEIMGMLYGYAKPHCIVVQDSFAVPTTGTDTSVVMSDEDSYYQYHYSELSKKACNLARIFIHIFSTSGSLDATDIKPAGIILTRD